MATTKVIIELTDPLSGSGLTKRTPLGGNKFENNAMAFYEKDYQDTSNHHNRPLYVIATVRDV